MAAQNVVHTQLVDNGVVYNVKLIENPTIDDILVTEAKIYAHSMATGTVDESRRVGRDIRDFLINTGVER